MLKRDIGPASVFIALRYVRKKKPARRAPVVTFHDAFVRATSDGAHRARDPRVADVGVLLEHARATEAAQLSHARKVRFRVGAVLQRSSRRSGGDVQDARRIDALICGSRSHVCETNG
jgi:hypothetical protein